MNKEPEDPSPITKSARRQTSPQNDNKAGVNGNGGKNDFLARLLALFRGRPDTSLRETIEEYIEGPDNGGINSISGQEKALISNILKLRGLTVVDVMIPRADIVAINVSTSQEDLLSLLAEKQYSRLPVYKGNLDKTLGTIHIKDILAALAKGKEITVKPLIRECPIVSPSLHVLDLLLQMKESRKHMAFVVDEYGGIDGLVTINDVIESIVGEIEDEYEPDNHAALELQDDGSILADARVYLDEFEQQFGGMLSADEREENDTLGGLVFHIAGRVPARGEILTHASGMAFEILDADKRRVNRLCIRNIPS